MFIINEDNSIYITRGDVAFFSVATETEDGEAFKFHSGDVVRFKVFEKKACENVVLQKDFGIEEDTEEALIYLEEKDTKIGGVISKPVDYWYEVELNPYTDPQTIIGYDEDGAKVFKLYPEGNEKEDEEPITPEDIPVVDEELDLTSTRPVQNQAISRAILKIRDDVYARAEALEGDVEARMNALQEDVHSGLADARGQRVTNVAEPVEDTDAINKAYFVANNSKNFKRELTADDDLNNITEPGNYFFLSNSVPANSFFQNASIVEVVADVWNGGRVLQRITRYGTAGYTAFRTLHNGEWTDWSLLAEIRQKVVTGTTNSNGNIGLGLSETNLVLGVRGNNYEIAIPYFYKDSEWKANIMSPSDFTRLTDTPVDLVVYYTPI